MKTALSVFGYYCLVSALVAAAGSLLYLVLRLALYLDHIFESGELCFSISLWLIIGIAITLIVVTIELADNKKKQ